MLLHASKQAHSLTHFNTRSHCQSLERQSVGLGEHFSGSWRRKAMAAAIMMAGGHEFTHRLVLGYPRPFGSYGFSLPSLRTLDEKNEQLYSDGRTFSFRSYVLSHSPSLHSREDQGRPSLPEPYSACHGH